MNILSINTAFSESYVSVTTSTHGFVYKHMDSSLKQSENILGLIDICLEKLKISLKNIDAIACVIGPGSFTGIRIGASIAKGFCTALPKIKRIAINSLDLLAFQKSKKGLTSDFWVVLNALSGNLFACKYNKNGVRICEPMLVYGEELKNITGIVVGLQEESLEIATEYLSFSSEALAEFAIMLNSFEQDCQDFEPVYLRKSQAEAELDKKEKNNK